MPLNRSGQQTKRRRAGVPDAAGQHSGRSGPAEEAADRPGASVGTRIRQAMEAMTPAERKVGRTILAKYPMAGLGTVAELAAEARVSNPTVVRFVNKLGFVGHAALQATLRQEVAERFRSPLSRYGEARADLSLGARLDVALETFRSGLNETFGSLAATEVESTVALLAEPKRRILCIGGRYSRILAEALRADLHLLRPNTDVYQGDSRGIAEALLDMRKGDVLVLFDFRRYQPDMARAARLASDRGAKVVLITDPWMSPAAEHSDHVLAASVAGLSPLGSMVAGLALVETLILGLIERLGDRPQARLQRFDELQAGAVLDPGPQRQ
jgi:DNA-binding MurR/RpiR family transcriptional regulator